MQYGCVFAIVIAAIVGVVAFYGTIAWAIIELVNFITR